MVALEVLEAWMPKPPAEVCARLAARVQQLRAAGELTAAAVSKAATAAG